MFCRHCGKEIPDASQFCKHCGEKQRPAGAEIEKPKEAVSTSVTPSAKRSLNAKAIVAAAAVVVVVAIVAVFNFRGGDGVNGVGQNAGGATQQIVEPRTLEEWVAVNDPALPSRLRSDLQTDPLLNGSWSNIDANVTGNTITLSYYSNDLDSSNQSILDSTWTFLESELGDIFTGVDEKYPELLGQIEQKTGIAPINCLLEFRYRDGGLMYTIEYTAQGRTDDSWFKNLLGL